MMRIVWLALVVSLSLSHCVRGEEPVSFSSATLKAAVEEALWITDPTPTDMLGLTRLSCPNAGIQDDAITSLKGLEHATNLQTLNLRYHRISSVSTLAGLTNLRTLNLSQNLISSISPLSSLTNLKSLDVHGNFGLSSLSAVSGMSELETLILRWNEVSSISALSGLENLKKVVLFACKVRDISPLAGLTHLNHLDLRENPLNQAACDVYIPKILANNPGIEIKYDTCVRHRLTVSSSAGGDVLEPGEGEFTRKGDESVWMEAEAHPGFVFAQWSGSFFSTQNPMFFTIERDITIRAGFLSLADTLYVDDDATGDPDEDGTAEHPFDGIQEAIEVAADGTLIVVGPGLYEEDISFLGKDIHLMASALADPNVMSYPVISGTGEDPVVSFTRGESADCMLMGFVITAGQEQQGGAVFCLGSSPTVANCLIVGNCVSEPDAVAVCCSDSSASFINCTIADNCSGAQGVGLAVVDSNVTVVNSIVWNNGGSAVVCEGSGVLSIQNSAIEGAWPGPGNIDSDPLFARDGDWSNADDAGAVWTAGDYHLRSSAGRWDPTGEIWVLDEAVSPCIDAGDSDTSVADEPEPNGGRINAGAYGTTAQASKSP